LWRKARKARLKIEKDSRRDFEGLIIYLWWNIKKEENQRTFETI